VNRIRKSLAGLYYGWRMIGLVSALRVLGGGLHQYGFTVFFLPVTQDLGLTRASTSLAFSLARAEGSLAAPIVGYLIDRYGPKPMMFTAALLAGIGYILFSFVNSYATFLMVYLGVISLSFTAGFVHAPTVIANSWFIRLRARAMTVVSAAVPVGGALITPLLGIAVHTFGWRWAAFFAGVLFLVAGLPLCIGIKRSPESIGMAADGAPLQNTSGERSQDLTSNNQEPEITAREAFRSPIFWNLICSMTCRSVAFTTVTTHFIPMMVWKGLSQTEASVLLAAFAIFNLPIHFLLGWIADFVNKPKLVTICLLLGVVAVLPMLWSDSLWALWFFACLYTVIDASIPVFWASVGDFFGRKSFGTIRGNMNLFYTWGAILGPFAAGMIYDRTAALRPDGGKEWPSR
jgi:MFS family permease